MLKYNFEVMKKGPKLLDATASIWKGTDATNSATKYSSQPLPYILKKHTLIVEKASVPPKKKKNPSTPSSGTYW